MSGEGGLRIADLGRLAVVGAKAGHDLFVLRRNFFASEAMMTIWKPRPASELPRIPLSRWRIFELADGSRHFVGVDMFDRSGRVSSPIVMFDPVSLQGTTHTVRIYELVGKPGAALQAEYVWQRWCELYDGTSYTDVTERLFDGADDDNAP